MRKNTKGKYYEFMCVLYDMKEFDITEMRTQYRVGARLITLMREHKMIKRDGNVTRWIGDKPTQAIAVAFAKECLKESRIANAQSKAGPQQMKLTPIKKVERTQPAPVQEEPIQDTSNSKLLLIMAVGAAIGFLVATIIWK
jgi:hypothetical protein